MHIGSTGPVPVRGARLAVIKLECQKLSRLYRLGLAGSTALCKITAVVPLVLPAHYRRALTKLAVKCLHLISSGRLYRLGLAGSSGPAGTARFWSRWPNASGCTAGAPVQPALRENFSNGRISGEGLKGGLLPPSSPTLLFKFFTLSLLHCCI